MRHRALLTDKERIEAARLAAEKLHDNIEARRIPEWYHFFNSKGGVTSENVLLSSWRATK